VAAPVQRETPMSRRTSRARRFLAWLLTELAFRVFDLSDWLSGGKYRDDLSCERRFADAVWEVGYWLYGHGCDMYGVLDRRGGRTEG